MMNLPARTPTTPAVWAFHVVDEMIVSVERSGMMVPVSASYVIHVREKGRVEQEASRGFIVHVAEKSLIEATKVVNSLVTHDGMSMKLYMAFERELRDSDPIEWGEIDEEEKQAWRAVARTAIEHMKQFPR